MHRPEACAHNRPFVPRPSRQWIVECTCDAQCSTAIAGGRGTGRFGAHGALNRPISRTRGGKWSFGCAGGRPDRGLHSPGAVNGHSDAPEPAAARRRFTRGARQGGKLSFECARTCRSEAPVHARGPQRRQMVIWMRQRTAQTPSSAQQPAQRLAATTRFRPSAFA
jgi:hypothetical protein